jgi:iron complex outermembrane receptor protein
VSSYAGYAQASYAFNDQFKISGNIRYSYDHKWGTETARYIAFNSTIIDGFGGLLGANTPSVDATPGQTCLTGNPANCATGPLGKGVTSAGVILPNGFAMRNLGATSSAVTGGAGIEWTPTSDIFVYARYGRGYESMSFNAGQILPNPEVSPEFLNSYEVGYKQSIGRTFSVDIAAFYYDYEGLQLPIAILNGGVTQSQFINVPKAVSDGIELETSWNPVKDLVLALTYSYDHTSITTGCSGTVTSGKLTPALGSLCILDTNDPAAVEPGANPFPGQTTAAKDQGVNGNPLPNAPLHKLAFTMAYTFHFEPGSLTLDGSYIYRSSMVGDVFNRFYNTSPSWEDVDLRATWKGANDRYEIIGYIKNIFNSLQYTVANGGAGLAGSANAVGLNEVNIFSLAPPRTYGVEMRYKFF